MKTVYECEICGTKYPEASAAQSCENRPFEPRFKVGDIVLSGAGYGWFDGKVDWVENFSRIRGSSERVIKNPDHGNCFDFCCMYQFYYVVTVIDRDDRFDKHRIRYHLRTMACGQAQGYNYDEHHFPMTLAKDVPQSVIEDSKLLIGQPTTRLL